MEQSFRVEAPINSPLATVDQIQRRLIRPSPQFQSPIPITTASPIPITTASSSTREKFRKQSNVDLKANMTIEDYLDPALLSIARAQIGVKKRKSDCREMEERKYDHFKHWPIDNRLGVSNKVSNRKQRREAEEAADLGQDTDFMGADEEFALK